VAAVPNRSAPIEGSADWTERYRHIWEARLDRLDKYLQELKTKEKSHGRKHANKDSFEVTMPSEQEIRMTRLFDAPRHLVFEAMTKPEHVKQWWGCLGEGYSVPVCEIDLRPGGAWRFVNRHPKGEAAFHGEYREITPPSRLVFTEIFEEFPDTVRS